MKILFYLLAVVFGLVGLLGLIRFLETMVFGGQIFPVQLLIGLGGIGIAVAFIKKARTT